jgi:hypothetical protein
MPDELDIGIILGFLFVDVAYLAYKCAADEQEVAVSKAMICWKHYCGSARQRALKKHVQSLSHPHHFAVPGSTFITTSSQL